VVAVTIWAMNNLSPFYSAAERGSGLGNFTQAMMFTYGSLCQQGQQVHLHKKSASTISYFAGGVFQPSSLSGRFVVGFWWIFAIATVATYTGNLIAFLTVSIDFKPFKSIQDMVVGPLTYGFVGGTDLQNLLKGKQNSAFVNDEFSERKSEQCCST
jgi:hypothetical protein